jgi:hypothetical protein
VDLIPKTRLEGGNSVAHGLVNFTDAGGFLFIDLADCGYTNSSDAVVITVFRDIASREKL